MEEAELFLILPNKNIYPDYYDIVTSPISLDCILKKIKQGGFSSTLEQVENDFALMSQNARLYNLDSSPVFGNAEALRQVFYERQDRLKLPLPANGYPLYKYFGRLNKMILLRHGDATTASGGRMEADDDDDDDDADDESFPPVLEPLTASGPVGGKRKLAKVSQLSVVMEEELDAGEEPGDVEYVGEQDDETEEQLNARGWRKGYCNQQKGVLQLLRERGLFLDGMHGKLSASTIRKNLQDNIIPDPALFAFDVLANCADYKLEKCALRELWEHDGDIFQPSVKGHPELAGYGIEYSWGMSKRYFKKHIDKVPAHLQLNVSVSLAHVKIQNVWAFERRTRDLMRTYAKLQHMIEDDSISQENISHTQIEDMRELGKVHRCHRNVMEIELKCIKAEEQRVLGIAASSSSSLSTSTFATISVITTPAVPLLAEAGGGNSSMDESLPSPPTITEVVSPMVEE